MAAWKEKGRRKDIYVIMKLNNIQFQHRSQQRRELLTTMRLALIGNRNCLQRLLTDCRDKSTRGIHLYRNFARAQQLDKVHVYARSAIVSLRGRE